MKRRSVLNDPLNTPEAGRGRGVIVPDSRLAVPPAAPAAGSADTRAAAAAR
ncbi:MULTISPECIES: hypothetical protein [Kitasatospora]|uniref:hypothetical protein n=1 Tax=Kitasatospora TaxID=2063 RepID=UPI000313BCAB|nr:MULTISPECIES: hypothetical protein [Kitasatospora]